MSSKILKSCIWIVIGFFVFNLMKPSLFCLTIEEKKASFLLEKDEKELRFFLADLNKNLRTLKDQLQEKYELVGQYHQEQVTEEVFQNLLKEVNEIRFEMIDLEKKWRDIAISEAKKEDEGYALWDQEEISLSHLVMEYGSSDYLYIIPPEMIAMKLHMHSGLPIPRESWSELLEIILSQSGVGIKQLNPFTRQLYLLKQDLISVDCIISREPDLIKTPPKARIVYIFSPPPERIGGVCQFFERFRDPKTTFVYQVGYKIAIISSKEEVEKLLVLYGAVWEKENEKVTKVIPLKRISSIDMEKIVKSYFGNLTQSPRISLNKGEGEDLILVPLKSEASLAFIGLKDVVARAEKLVKEIEGQVEDPKEMVVYWYNCRHSDPIDIAEVLEKVYTSLIYSRAEGGEVKGELQDHGPFQNGPPEQTSQLSPPLYGPPPYSPVVQPLTAVAATIEAQKEKSFAGNFIPYPKTGAIMMVVRRDTLEKIKELISKLDVPKKMVQIEVLLFEKRISNKNNFGLNMLKLGSAATNTKATGLSYNNSLNAGVKRGIVDFFIFRKKPNHFWPSFDIAYNFLMAQEDVRINAAPSVTTLNQTPAQISLVQEISIDNGAAPIDGNTGVVFQTSYSRAQYGTTLVITPTIHEKGQLDDERHSVTLETNITFDTIKKTTLNADRPQVSRRHIENHVRVIDGETVILGGLREKTAEDSSSKLPFLGEIPGLGKFFGESQMSDEKTEMFIFITPKIIFDAKGEFDQVRKNELLKRPGDLPEFLERINEAKKRKKERLFNNSLKLMFGKVDG